MLWNLSDHAEDQGLLIIKERKGSELDGLSLRSIIRRCGVCKRAVGREADGVLPAVKCLEHPGLVGCHVLRMIPLVSCASSHSWLSYSTVAIMDLPMTCLANGVARTWKALNHSRAVHDLVVPDCDIIACMHAPAQLLA